MDSANVSGEQLDGLQFDHAEGGEMPAGRVECASCSVEVDTYFAVGDAALCENCKNDVESQFKSRTEPKRLGKALLYGLPAAMVGSAIYYAIVAVTDYEIGLVAILIGFMVGAAVKAAAGPGGGRRYQVLAAGLTYCAIVTTYVPFVIEGLQESEMEEPAESSVAAASESDIAQEDAEAVALPAEVEPPTAAEFMIGVAVIFAIAFVAPFLAGIENIMGLLIIGFGVYQAWKMNKRVHVEITGPHVVGTPSAVEPA